MAHDERQTESRSDTEHLLEQQTVQIDSTAGSCHDEQATVAGTINEQAKLDLEILPKLPGYTIESILGRGGMGVVYHAHQRPLNRPVALKMILSGEHAAPEDRLRFLAEAESIAKIQHTGIVQLYEFGSHEGHPYFALEYISGGTLERKLAGTPLPPQEAASLIEKMARAIQAAHDQGIVHRDLKPANVLLTPKGDPKITDFGLAKSGGSNLTATGAILGTPSYMAPEQADGRKDVGKPTDIYALGAILYECLTGRPPFKAATHVDTILQVVHSEPVSVRHLQSTTPQDLETICHKCLSKEPEKRYITAAALADDLSRFIRQEPIEARPVGRVEKLWRWCRRNPVVSGLAGSVALLLMGVAVASLLVSWHVQRQNSDLEEANIVSKRNEEKAHAAAEEAKQERDKSRLLLGKQYAANATRSIEEGDTGGALIWTAEAIKQSGSEPTRDRIHRIQFRELLQRQARPIGVWEARDRYFWNSRSDKNSERTFFSNDGRIALIPTLNDFEIIHLPTGQSLTQPTVLAGMSAADMQLTPDGSTIIALYYPNEQPSIRTQHFLPMLDVYGGMRQAVLDAVEYLNYFPNVAAWEPATGKIKFRKLLDLSNKRSTTANTITLSPNGVHAHLNGSILDIASGKIISTIPFTGNYSCCFDSRSNKVMISSSSRIGLMQTRVWNFETHQWTGEACVVPGEITDSGFDEKGRPLVLCLCSEGQTPHMYSEVWDIHEKKRVAGPIACLMQTSRQQLSYSQFSPKLNMVMAKAWSSFAIFDVASNKSVMSQGSYDDNLETANFSRPNGGWVITGSRQGKIEFSTIADGKPAASSISLPNSISLSKFARNGNQLIVATKDGLVHIHEITKHNNINTFDKTSKSWVPTANSEHAPVASLQHPGEVVDAVMDEDGRSILTFWNDVQGKTQCTLWSLASPSVQMSKLSSENIYFHEAVFYRQNQHVLLSSSSIMKLIGIASPMNGSLNFELPESQFNRTHSVISLNEKYYLAASGWTRDRDFSSQYVRIILNSLDRTSPATELLRLTNSTVFDLRFSPDSNRCAAVIMQHVGERGYQTLLCLWDTVTGKKVCEDKRFEGWGGQLFFSNDSKQLTYFVRDGDWGKNRCYATVDGAELPSSRSSQHGKIICHHLEKQLLFTLSNSFQSSTACVWDTDHFEKPLWQFNQNINHAQFSADGSKLATASGVWNQLNGDARVWESKTGHALSPVLKHPRPVQRVLFVDHDRLVVTIADGAHRNEDGHMVYLWDAQTGMKLIPPWSLDGHVLDATYDEPSHCVLIVSNKGTLWRWKIDISHYKSGDVDAIAQAMTGKQIDATGGISFSTVDEQRATIMSFKNHAPDMFNLTKSMAVEWHQARLSRSSIDTVILHHLNRLIELEPEKALHRGMRAACFNRMGQYQKALEDLNRALEQSPDQQALLEQRGFLLCNAMAEEQAKTDKAQAQKTMDLGIDDLEKAAKQDVLGGESCALLNDLTWRLCCQEDANPKSCERLGKLFKPACEFQDKWMYNNTLSLCYLRSGQYAQAIKMSEKCLLQAKEQRNDQKWPLFCSMLSDYSNRYVVPVSHVWAQYDLSDLIILGMAQIKSGRQEDGLRTGQLIRILRLNPNLQLGQGVDGLIKEWDKLWKAVAR